MIVAWSVVTEAQDLSVTLAQMAHLNAPSLEINAPRTGEVGRLMPIAVSVRFQIATQTSSHLYAGTVFSRKIIM